MEKGNIKVETVTRDEIEKIARLSYITIQENLLAQFSSVVQYVARVKEIGELKKEKVTMLTKQPNVLRQDTVISTDAAIVLENTPQKESNYIVVPMILETN